MSIPDSGTISRTENGDSTLPKGLTEIERWVIWYWKQRGDELTKVLHDPETNFPASVDKPHTWGALEQAVIAQNAYNAHGIGIIFSQDDTLAGVDLDGCIDPDTGELHPDAQAIIDELDSYTEISPSGTGVKIFVHGLKPGDCCQTKKTPWGDKIEMYDSGRFFTVTGDHLPGTSNEVTARQRAFKALYARFFGEPDTRGSNAPAPGPSPLTDEQLITEAERIHGDKFRKLFYDGDISAYDNDDHLGRAALIGIVRWYAHDDPEQIERIMRHSNLDLSRADDKRKGQPFINYEIDRLTEKPLDSYYEVSSGLSGSEFVSVDPNTPHQQKRNESENGAVSEFVSVDEGGANRQKRKLPFKTVQEVLDECGDKPDWVWHGFLARGWLTDLAGPAKKSGKTTLMLSAVRHVLDGRPFLEYETRQAKVVYLTEQSASVSEAIHKAGLDKRNDGLHVLQWKDIRDRSWPELVEGVFEYAAEVEAQLVIVDTLNRFAGLKGEQENDAGHVADAMNPLLQAAQTHNMAVLSIRHANKEGKARGSTQFDHDVDILLELQPSDGNMGDNVRVLHGIGRSDDVPAKISAELTPDGYRNLGDDEKVRFMAAVRAVTRVVSKDPNNPTPKPDLEALLKDENVALTTGRDAVKWLCDKDEIKRTGEGKRGSPYAYYMPPLYVDVGG